MEIKILILLGNCLSLEYHWKILLYPSNKQPRPVSLAWDPALVGGYAGTTGKEETAGTTRKGRKTAGEGSA